MSLFDAPTQNVIGIRLECISKVDGTDGLWWVAESLADGGTQPRGVFADLPTAERKAEDLATQHGVPIMRKSHVE